ncbi:MAG: diguanylate cyclase [Actinomycetota bacterium]
MTTRLGVVGAVLGAVGLALGVANMIAGAAVLGLIAGLVALASGAACVYLDRVARAEVQARSLVEDQLRTANADPDSATDVAPEGPPIAEKPSPEESPEPPAGSTDDDSEPDSAADLHIEPTAPPSVAEFVDSSAPTNDPSSLVDSATGLFSESFFRVALDGRIAAARRHLRPVALVLVEVVRGLPAEAETVDAGLVSETIGETLREADTACRLHSGHFALLLEDTPENGAIWTVERIRRKLLTDHDGMTVWAGVACYPAHAFSSEELFAAAETALVAAREWRQDRIEVATAAD